MEKTNKITISDVAQKAGVSNATVSMAMADSPKITNKTKEIVTKAVKELNYKKRKTSKNNLSCQKTESQNLIGFITYFDYSFQWWFAKDFILTIKDELAKHGYIMILFYCNKNTDMKKIFQEIQADNLSGLIILHYNGAAFLSKLNDLNLPMILLNNTNFQFRYNSVCADDFQGAYDGTRTLISYGHKNIAFLEFERPQQPSTLFDRYFGFRKALEEYSLPFPQRRKITVKLHDMKELKIKLENLLEKDKDITALFIHDDYFTLDVVKILRQLNKKVYSNYSIIAFGDTIPYEESFFEPVSTMQINKKEMSVQTVNMLIKLLSGTQKSIELVKISEKYVDRGTIRNLKD